MRGARGHAWWAGVALATLCAAVSAQRPERIHVIGASVSGGFTDGPMTGAPAPNNSVALYRVLRRWCGPAVKVTTHSPTEMCAMFRDPAAVGAREVALARHRRADAVVAIDFLFWFVYGYTSGDAERQREARFERGLELLDRLDVPLIVGDLPDMRGASVRMLKPRQIPSAALLQRVNERLRAWARARGDVQVVGLSALLRELRDQGVVLPRAAGDLRTPPAALLQSDRLHATRLGMATLVYRMQGTLQHLFPKAHALHGHAWAFDRFVEAAGAEVELEDLLFDLSAGRGK